MKHKDNEALFYSLLQAETEEEVLSLLSTNNMLDESRWFPLGDTENNWSTAGNQQTAAAAALVEKLVNGIDAVLIRECLSRGINPESQSDAPPTMAEAARVFFNIPNGRLENVDPRDRTELADNIQLVAVGNKSDPNYLVIDKGEGQTPMSFPGTFLSLAKSNKLRIPFVQGKYNAGGTGALRFCGRHNFQLVVSRRAPMTLNGSSDPTDKDWGFTLIRRLRPEEGDSRRRSSMYVYYGSTDGRVLSFRAPSINVLPEGGAQNKAPKPYSGSLAFGTCLKLYAYKWKAAGIATRDPRYEVNRYLHNLVLPIRITETRDGYRANSYSTTASGGSVDENVDLDLGPASGSIALPRGLGTVPVELKVFKDTKSDGSPIDTRHLPTGIIFTVNGQVHGALSSTFVSRKLNYPFLEDYLSLVIDATEMPPGFREDFFMVSRDRIADGEDKDFIETEIKEFLKSHDGLRELNNKRKQTSVSKTVEESQPLDVLQELVKNDPTLAALFGHGEKVKVPFGPVKEPVPFVGQFFPTYFRPTKQPVIKRCPINRSCRVEFETDAVDDYFSRGNEPGSIKVAPVGLFQGHKLFRGICAVRLAPPINANVGDRIDVTITVADPSREANPFELKVQVIVESKALFPEKPPQPVPPKPPMGSTTGFPQIWPVGRDEWPKHKFDEHSGLRFTGGIEEDDELEIWVNIDNVYFLNEAARATDDAERPLIRHYYKYGLALVCLGMLQESRRAQPKDKTGDEVDDLANIARLSGGVASVIVPVVRSLAATAAKALSR